MSKRSLLVVVLAVFLMSLSIPLVSQAQGDVELRWRTRPDNQAEIDLYQSISDSVDKSWDGVTLKYEAGGTEGAGYQQTLLTEVAAGTAPDVFWIPGASLASFAKAGAILNLADYADKAKFDTSVYYPQQIKELTFDPAGGKALWGLPRDASSFALYYNEDLFAEAGIDTPAKLIADGKWTWDTFTETAKAISELSSGDNKIVGAGMSGWWANWLVWINAAANNGRNNYFNEDRTGCGLNQQATTDAFTFLSNIYSNGWAVPFGSDPEAPFVAGTVGMFMNGRWATPNAIQNLKFKWNVAELPTAPGGGKSNWLFWGAYVVNAKTANPEKAFELATRLTSVDVESQVTAKGANLPSLAGKDAVDAFLKSLTDVKPELNNAAFSNALQYAVAEGPLWTADYDALDAVVGGEVTKVMSGDVKPEDFTKSICDQMDTFFKK